MGAVATAVAQLNTDNTALTSEQAQLVKDQQAVATDQGNIATAQGAITTDDAAVVSALQSLQVAGQPPVSVYFPPDANGVQQIYSLAPGTPPGFTVTTAVPA